MRGLTRSTAGWGVLAATAAVWSLLAYASTARGAESPAAGSSEEEIDPIAVAAVLIQDKHFERAKDLLAGVDVKTVKTDLDRFYLLFGLALLELDDHRGAKEKLGLSIKAGQKDPIVHLFYAQALFALEEYGEVDAAMKKAGKAADRLPGAFLLHGQSLWRVGEKHRAYHVFSKGIALHPDDQALRKNRVLLLVDLGLYQEAVRQGTSFLEASQSDVKEYVALSQALLAGKQHTEAIYLLETARLRHPEEPVLIIQLARVYLDAGHPLIAARLFEHASRQDEKLVLDAAELYRRAGRLSEAERLNAKVADQKAKIRQRLGLLIELHRFEEAAALAPRLLRLGLLEEDAVAYGLAYAYFMTGRFSAAERQLKRISDAALFEKAIQLRRVMGTCSASGWQCP